MQQGAFAEVVTTLEAKLLTIDLDFERALGDQEETVADLTFADHFDAALVHLNHRDVTLLAISRAPLETLQAYKRRMGWQFPYVSSFRSDFNFDFGFAYTDEEMASGELATMVEGAPEWLREWAENVGTDLAAGMAENPGWNVFARDDGAIYHTYSRTAPDRFLSAYYELLLDQVPSGRGADFPLLRHDEY